MSNRLKALPAKEQRGSRARCILLTDGSDAQVARRLTALVAPHAIVRPGRHVWAPRGVDDPAEAKLGESPSFLSAGQREAISNWWLAVRSPQANTPNWDMVSQATIEGREGLLLVEAKAHNVELINEEKGKTLPEEASENGRRNHERIGRAIRAANTTLEKILPGWNLARDSHYQMSNRFAWGWKLAELGVPVILVYLGFLNADEMRDKGEPIVDDADWHRLVKAHSARLFPAEVWNARWEVHGQPFIPIIRTIELSLEVVI